MRKLLVALLVICAALAGSRASADTVTLGGIGANGTMIQVVNTNLGNEYMGQLSVNWNSEQFIAYCVDLYSTVYIPGTMTVTPKSMASLPDPAETNPLHVNADTGLRVSWLFNTYQLGGLVTNVNQASALQAAIWEVLYDWNGVPSSLDVQASGNFWVNNATVSGLAQGYLNALGSQTFSGSNVVWLDQTLGQNGQSGQDLVVGHAVPEPATLMLFGFGVLVVSGKLRRRSQ